MKAIIFAGGYGTRISEETGVRPKPMVEIGGKPILWHIMKIYSYYGINDFIICCGYKGEIIKDFFTNYHIRNADITFDLAKHTYEVHKNGAENWKVTLVNTGENTSKSGRLLKVKNYIGNETFCLTYGDGVSDINIDKLIKFHKSKKHITTVTAVKSPGRFGAFSLRGRETQIKSFREKPIEEGVWINGGFFVMEPEVFDYIKDETSDLEESPMRNLAKRGQLIGYKHTGFWHPMDTLRDKNVLEQMWLDGKAPWKVWK